MYRLLVVRTWWFVLLMLAGIALLPRADAGAQVTVILKGSCSDGPVTLNATDIPLLGATCSSAGTCANTNPEAGVILAITSEFTCDSTPVDNFATTAINVGDEGVVATANGKSVFFNRLVGTGFGTASCISGLLGPNFVNHPEGCSPPPPPPPTPSPTPTPSCNPEDPSAELQSGSTTDPSQCTSPIIIDTGGNGYRLTSAADGVMFDISGKGDPIRLGWTTPGSGDAFLALPGPDGMVTNGTQLFGNFTPQPPSDRPNGYAALAVYDQLDHGGNGDGVIDQKDQIFSSLRLWLDDNHDGICQPGELHKLPELGVFSISLSYSLSHRVDGFGNVFRYRADVNSGMSGESEVGRKAFDVFLTTH